MILKSVLTLEERILQTFEHKHRIKDHKMTDMEKMSLSGY